MVLKGADKPWPPQRQVLRLLPISGGIFAGPFKVEAFAPLTAEALLAGYEQLQSYEKEWLREIDIRMCIFEEKEFKAYLDAFASNDRVQVEGYSVLGQQQLKNRKIIDVPGKEPDPKYVTIVDPAGEGYIKSQPRDASGASGSIYAHLGIEEWPEDVKGQITTCEAVAHAYPMRGKAKQRVVHVIGPDFRKKMLAGQKKADLTKAYRNVLHTYIQSSVIHKFKDTPRDLFYKDCFRNDTQQREAFTKRLNRSLYKGKQDKVHQQVKQMILNYKRSLNYDGLRRDLKVANVKFEDYNNMIMGVSPLGMSQKQFKDLCADLIECIKQSQAFKRSEVEFNIVVQGTSVTFYSENPSKANRFFDSEGKGKSDIDIAIVLKCDDLQEFEDDKPPLDPFVRLQQVSQVDTQKVLRLKSFYQKWGPHDYFTGFSENKLGRNIGVVLRRLRDPDVWNSIVVTDKGVNMSMLKGKPFDS